MSNPWIEHVKKYAKTHQLSYGDALLKAKESYTRTTGGSRKSDIVRVLIGTNKFDINRVSNPSQSLKDKYEYMDLSHDDYETVEHKRNIQSMKDCGLIDEKTMPTKKQLIRYGFYKKSAGDSGMWGDIDKLITDDIGILRKDNFITAYMMIYGATPDNAQKEYTKARSKRRKKIHDDGYLPKVRQGNIPKPKPRNLLMLGY
jgi:hypothetical protein